MKIWDGDVHLAGIELGDGDEDQRQDEGQPQEDIEDAECDAADEKVAYANSDADGPRPGA